MKKLFWVKNLSNNRKEGPFASKKQAKEIRRSLNPQKDGKEILEWVITIGPDHHRAQPIGTSRGYARSRVWNVVGQPA